MSHVVTLPLCCLARRAARLAAHEDILPFPDQVELRLRAVVESAPSGLVMTDSGGRITLVNARVERLFAYPREELLGQPVEILLPERFRDAHPTLRAGFIADPQTRAMGQGREVWGRRKDGSEFPIEVILTPVATADGLFVISAITDLTTRRIAQAEHHRLEEELLRVQKMEAVGTLAGGVAHEFNNILGAIMAYGELVRDAVRDQPEALGDLDELLKTAVRGKGVIEQMMRIGRRSEVARRAADLAQMVTEAVPLVRAGLPSGVDLRLQVDPVPPVLADVTAVQQALMSLVANAVQAMPRGGTLEILLQRCEVPGGVSAAHSTLRHGPAACLTVRDTGDGMDASVRARAFDPFFTTRGPGRGVGLGLALVHGILRDHEGAVEMESEPGHGTVVRCVFPGIVGGPAPIPAPAAPIPASAAERILLVDDESGLAIALARRLERLGFRVDAHADPRTALDAFRQDPARFDLVVTDLSMPYHTGLELAAEIRALRPELPVLLLTGFIDEVHGDRLTAAGIRRLVTKPVAMAQLSVAIHEVLHG